eukprot:scaffold100532_cov54-Phaeocystis_antarctica.AAC.3
MPQRKLVAGAAVPAAMRLPAPVLSTAFAALEQRKLAAISSSGAEVQAGAGEGAEAYLEGQEGAGMPAAMRLQP